MVDYKIEAMVVGDSHGVYEFLKKSFFLDEPLTYNLVPPGREECIALRGVVQGLSYKAIDTEGNIIGAVFNMDFSKYHHSATMSETMKKVADLLDFVESKADLDSDTGDTLTLQAIAVLPSWRRKGVGRELMRKTEELAKEKGYRQLEVTCTSLYSARAIQSLGWTRKYSLKYSDYTDSLGMPVFRPPPPHTEVQVFTKQI